MKLADFEHYRDLLLRNSGLSLAPEKTYLLDSNLTPVCRKWGYPTLDAMTLALRGVPDIALLNEVIEAMTVKDTSFFRDGDPFTTLRDVIIPSLIKRKGRKRKLRIWSAGCSTGQETYSIAMTLKEIESKLKGYRIDILGTDLSSEALLKARTGDYTQFEVQRGLPVMHLMKYFDELDDSWRLHDNIRNLVHFEQANLLDNYDELGQFDIIFCRNVVGHFEDKARNDILKRLAESLTEGGFLILGQDEHVGTSVPSLRTLNGCNGFLGLTSSRYDVEPLMKVASV